MEEKNTEGREQCCELPSRGSDADSHIYEDLSPYLECSQTDVDHFKNRTKDFIDEFDRTKGETRTNKETLIILHILKEDCFNSAVLGGNLEQQALLACCDSAHVRKRALDVLLNEIFLSISDFSTARCKNLLKAEEILRSSFLDFVQVDHAKAKCQRMTTYSWLMTLILLKSKEECVDILPEIREFDRVLETMLRDRQNVKRNTFRYGLYVARESIKRVLQLGGKRDSRESLQNFLKTCENFLDGKLEKDEVAMLARSLIDQGNWFDLHICLVFLQDLPKFYGYQDNPKPVILIQMLIAEYRERVSITRFKRSVTNYAWQFEILVYHLMRRLIKTTQSQAIIEQVLTGEHGCGGILTSWMEYKSKESQDEILQLAMLHLEKLCKKAVFVTTPVVFKQFLVDYCKGDENQLIEELSILSISSMYRNKILEILSETRTEQAHSHVSTYDALINGKKCLVKLHQHSKEELVEPHTPKTVSLREEIEIVKILNADPEQCRNVVQLLGSGIEKAPVHLIIERPPKGNLHNYLRGQENGVEAKILVQIASDVCDAMTYLGDHDIILRDLRAKNCFVFEQEEKLLTKLGDFHLAILSYSLQKSSASLDQQMSSAPIKQHVNEDIRGQFAVRWMAPEALRHGEFNTATDVWSFGVLLFEIFTFGSVPYTNMPSGKSLDDDETVRKFVLSGKKLELHPRIPKSIQAIIELTMNDVGNRPSFPGLKASLLEIRFPAVLYRNPAHFRILHRTASGIRQVQQNLEDN